MRGKVITTAMQLVTGRITPAYAGKRFADFLREASNEDHPRLCGEKLETRHDFTEKLGSPPPMRGKVPNHDSTQNTMGITPAYAGKRCSCRICRV